MIRKKKTIILIVLLAFVACVVGVLFPLAPYIRLAASLRAVRVQGEAMKPALHDSDKIFVSSNVEPLVRGDIVLLRYPRNPSLSYIKRIIGLPGEEIEIRDGQVFINGHLLQEPYVMQSQKEYYRPPTPLLRLPANEYFVMGDNRNYSSDSRDWGTVERNLIYGKYVYRYYTMTE